MSEVFILLCEVSFTTFSLVISENTRISSQIIHMNLLVVIEVFISLCEVSFTTFSLVISENTRISSQIQWTYYL